jgi:DNA-binding response OmpR family regulator
MNTPQVGLGVADALKHSVGIHGKPCDNCILILEDFDAIRAVMARHFEQEGFIVYSASTPFDARIIARNVNPRIVVIDYDLSNVNALDTINELRQVLPHSIIILSGGLLTQHTTERALARGANDVLPRGYELSKLDRVISQARVL